jgi:putative methionine-R-sulfoxide reductase with GAF domain
MFEFLNRQHKTNINSDESTLVLSETEPLINEKNQTIEHFIKAGDFQGSNLIRFSQELFSLIARQKEISQGVFFICDKNNGTPVLKFLSGYAYQKTEGSEEILNFGEGLPGQVAKDGKLINITDIPEGYMSIESGLGKASPASLIIFPVMHEGEMLAVIELASFHKFTTEDEQFFEDISPAIAEQMLKSISNT